MLDVKRGVIDIERMRTRAGKVAVLFYRPNMDNASLRSLKLERRLVYRQIFF